MQAGSIFISLMEKARGWSEMSQRQLLKTSVWSHDVNKNANMQCIIQAPKGLEGVTPLTCWRLHIKILQRRRLFGAFVFLRRLFYLCITRRVSPLGRDEAVCGSLSWNCFCSRKLPVHVSVFMGCRSPIFWGLGRGDVCIVWRFLSTTQPGKEKQIKFPAVNHNSFLQIANP